ncbi:MAG: hypothetical protein ACK4VN_00650 [Bacteroidales bacterium]
MIKNRNLFLLVAGMMILVWASCGKDDGKSERFRILTETRWMSDSLLINGIDASVPGGMLESFKGEADFRADGTGTFGAFDGRWQFDQGETELIISSDSLPLPLRTRIHELNRQSLKVSTSFPNLVDPTNPLTIRLTFKGE